LTGWTDFALTEKPPVAEQPVDPQSGAVLFEILHELLSDDPAGREILTQLQQNAENCVEELSNYLRRRLEADRDRVRALAETPNLPTQMRNLIYRSQVERIVSIAIAHAGTVQADTVIVSQPERGKLSLWVGLTALAVIGGGVILAALSFVGNRQPATPTAYSMPQVEPVEEFGSQTVSAIAQNPQNGDIWIAITEGQKSGLHRFTRGEGWTSFEPGEGKPQAEVQAILGRTNGEMWFATQGEGVTALLAGAGTLSEDDDCWQTYHTADGLIGSKLLAIAEDQWGNIWFGTYSGLCVLTPEGKWRYYDHETGCWTDDLPALPTEEERPKAHAIRVDGTGDVWAAMGSVLLRWSAGELGCQSTHYSREGALSNESRIGPGLLISLAFDEESRPWVGTTEGAVSVLKEGSRTRAKGDDKWQTYHEIAPDVDTAFVLVLLPLPDDGPVLAGTVGGGLRVRPPGATSWTGHPEFGTIATALFWEEEEKRVWIGTSQGLFLWRIPSAP
jgi:ligand-binding sensor domain-containing protein